MSAKDYKELPELLPQSIIEKAQKFSPAQLCDGMKGLGVLRDGCMDANVLPIDDSKIMIGTACTVDTEDGDNFPIHVALCQGKPGYVLVVAGKGCTERAYLGDLMGATAEAVGLGGIVIDGFVRDKTGLHDLSIPVYSKGFMQRGPLKKGPGKINTRVLCAGVVVEPGDLIIGDYDGVTVIPRDMIETVLEKTQEKEEYEVGRRKVISEYARCIKEGQQPPEIAPGWMQEMFSNQK